MSGNMVPTEYVVSEPRAREVDAPPHGQMPLVTAALAIGVLLMAIQLWLLTIALDLFLAGQGGQVWQLALVSGAIFAGGLVMLWLLRRRPHLRARG
jgi:hypothetical protein